MPFVHLSASHVVRAAALLPIAANTDYTIGDTTALGMEFEVVTAARTAGSITATLQGSFDGGTTYQALGSSSIYSVSGIATNKTTVISPRNVIPDMVRVVLTPAGGFDGTVAINFRTSSGNPS